MILVDASIWIDYINKGDPLLDRMLIEQNALMHPHVLGEIALGSIRNREALLPRLLDLPAPWVAKDGHVLDMVDRHGLWSTGIGYVDAHLLASALLTSGVRIWTRDKRLRQQAERHGVLAPLA